jgi:GAF domain-containing protein
VHESAQPLVIDDWSREKRFQEYGMLLSRLGIASTCTLPLIRGTRRLGVLSLGRFYPNAYDEEEVRFLGLASIRSAWRSTPR